jgi:hypothetical protein
MPRELKAMTTVKLSTILQSAEVATILEQSAIDLPNIPPGCNTVHKHIRLIDGRYGLVINQRGFIADDREAPGDEVNGLTLLLCEDCTLPEREARNHLELLFAELNKP